MVTEAISELFSRSFEQVQAKDLYTSEGAQLYAKFVHSDNAECDEVRRAGDLIPFGAVVGELAAGEGRLLLSLPREKINFYSAIDTSPFLLSALMRRLDKLGIDPQCAQVCCQDLRTWTPDPTAFDLLILGAGTARLFSRCERLEIYKSVRTALKPDGHFYISTSESLDSPGRLVCLGQTVLRGRPIISYFFDVGSEDATSREIGFLVLPIGKQTSRARLYSSTVLNLSADELVQELESAGFLIVEKTFREHESLPGFHERTTSIIAKIGN